MNQFHIETQKKVVNIDNKSFHLILLNIFLHLNIYWQGNLNLFDLVFFYFF